MTETNGPVLVGFLCSNGHKHGSQGSIERCELADSTEEVSWASVAQANGTLAPAPALSPASVTAPASVAPAHSSEPATPAQRATAQRLGGHLADNATRNQASRTIDTLIEARDERERRLKEQTDAEEVSKTELHQTKLGIPIEMIFAIRDGRFAVSLMGTKKLEFVRLMKIKVRSTGTTRYPGWMQVQTQHGDGLKKRAVISPTGEVLILSNTYSQELLVQTLMGIIVSQRDAAVLYGREKGMCCRCGKQLTDERSRHYGIGPECEKQWPEIIDEIDEQEGVFQYGEVL